MAHVDSESPIGHSTNTKDLSQLSGATLDETCGDNKAKVIEPITPDAKRENGDFPLDLSSPLTEFKTLSKVLTFDAKTDRNPDSVACIDDSNSPKTPKDGVFDPFAPGPDDKLWAPQCKKYFDEARISVARLLNFNFSFKVFGYSSHGDNVEFISDEDLLKSVYENLLEAIVSEQTESALAELSKLEWDSDACSTPISGTRTNGVAVTCPGAPMKPTGKSRIIDLGLCRKLEF